MANPASREVTQKLLNMTKQRFFLGVLVCATWLTASVVAQNTDKTVYVDEYQESGKFDKKSLDRKIRNFAKLLSRLPKTAHGILLYEIDIREHDCWEDIKYTAQLRSQYVISRLSEKYKIENDRLKIVFLETKTTESYILFGIISKNTVDLAGFTSLSQAVLINRERYIVDCFCPTFKVAGPVLVIDRVRPLRFTVSLDDWSLERNPVFTWTVSGGKIVYGQGSEVIHVDISSDESAEIKATAKLVGTGKVHSQVCMTSNSFNTKIVSQ